MMSINARLVALIFAGLAASVPGAHAGFHVMQIEEIIGGVNGNSSAQAIQLRLRAAGQNVVSAASLWVSDATGANRTLLLNIGSNVTNSAAGDRVLLTTAAFNNLMILGGNPGFTADFTLSNAIPAGFLSAGKLTFEQDGGTTTTPGFVYWSVAWGGASYTGTNTSSDSTNDSDGFFGDNLGHAGPFGSALPTASRQGIIFNGAATAASTNNAANYVLTANPATVTKNSGAAFTVVPEPALAGLLGMGALCLGGMCWRRRRA